MQDDKRYTFCMFSIITAFDMPLLKETIMCVSPFLIRRTRVSSSVNNLYSCIECARVLSLCFVQSPNYFDILILLVCCDLIASVGRRHASYYFIKTSLAVVATSATNVFDAEHVSRIKCQSYTTKFTECCSSFDQSFEGCLVSGLKAVLAWQ